MNSVAANSSQPARLEQPRTAFVHQAHNSHRALFRVLKLRRCPPTPYACLDIHPSTIFTTIPPEPNPCAEPCMTIERTKVATGPCISIIQRAAYCAALACLNRTSSSAACASFITVSRPSTCVWFPCILSRLRRNCPSTGARSSLGVSRREEAIGSDRFNRISSGPSLLIVPSSSSP